MKNQKTIFTAILLTLGCFAFLPRMQAVSPAPDGCYPNYTTAEGCDALQSLSDGVANTALGWRSLDSDTSGSFNTGVGAGALILNDGNYNTSVGAVALLLNSSGAENTAIGTQALLYNDASYNTASGAFALFSNTTGEGNTAAGDAALQSNTGGTYNTAVGLQALLFNNTTSYNTAAGAFALFANQADGNTAMGYSALFSNSTGRSNTAVGNSALFASTASENTAVGDKALYSNTEGADNTATGISALFNNTTGVANTAVGRLALFNNNGSHNTAIGSDALFNNVSGSFNTAIGDTAGISVITANSVTCIGPVGADDVSNTTWIGNVYGVTTLSGTTAPVIVSQFGQLGTVASSERFKKDIVKMEKTSEAVLSLRPVTFHYKTDTTGTPQFGLIAEEVAKVDPALVLPDKEGRPYTVRYDAVNAMLLNEFLKEHKKVEEQHAAIMGLKSIVAQQQKQIETLTAGLQKIGAQLVGKPTSHLVATSD